MALTTLIRQDTNLIKTSENEKKILTIPCFLLLLAGCKDAKNKGKITDLHFQSPK